MKLLLSDEEVKDIIASQSMEDIKMYSEGKYKKWNVEGCGDDGTGLEIEYIYTEAGDLKQKFAQVAKAEQGVNK